MSEPEKTVREAVALFDAAEALEAAIDALEAGGFDRAELSLLASEAAVEAELGHRYVRTEALEDDPSAPRTAYVARESIGDAEGGLIGALAYVGGIAAAGAVVASGGTLAGALAATLLAGGAGGLFGSALAKFVGERHAARIEEHLRRGGLVLWVRTRDAARETRAADILRGAGGRDVHIHDITV